MAQISTSQGDNITNLREYLYDEEGISYDDFEKILHTASEIFERCLSTGEDGAVKGLIYGQIQSGKTSVILTTMALAADNGFKNFIVMTSNLNDIYNQTIDRIKSALDSFQVFGKDEFKTESSATPGLPLVLVSSKHSGTLRRVSDVARKFGWQNQPVIMIDDEADQASLDTNINDDTKPTSAVNQAIVDLRNLFNSHTYLQTTATPQALLLQDNQSDFRPDFVVATEPGSSYVGGNYFFEPGDSQTSGNNFQESNHVRLVPIIDIARLRDSNQIPETVRRSLLVFFLGAAVLRKKGYKTKKYTYLLHTSFRQADHTLATSLIDGFKNELANQLKKKNNNLVDSISPELRKSLEDAYSDLERTFGDIPPFSEIIAEVARRITSTEVIEINSNTGHGISPKLARKHTLYIGGTKIGRGVTVENLLVTYYGRDAQQPQMDTVLQHARMYGYRKNELPSIRIYLPRHLANRFSHIHESDNLVREQCKATYQPIQTIPLLTRGIRPTRRNVLNQNTVTLLTYQGGRQYFPSLPVSDPNILGNQTQEIDKLLSDSKYPQLKHPYEITIDNLLEILDFKFAEDGSSSAWKDDLIRQAVAALHDQQIYENAASLVIINRSSKLKKSSTRSYAALGSVIPGDAGTIPYGIARNYPALLMTRLKGERLQEGGWDGSPFWVPVIRFPDGNYAFSVNES